jgi:hypothetical protein
MQRIDWQCADHPLRLFKSQNAQKVLDLIDVLHPILNFIDMSDNGL